MADKKRFKLSFRSTEVHGPGGETQRALIFATGPCPVKGWIQVILALEDGGMMQKVISQQDFDLAARKEIVMLEVEGERAAPVIYGADPIGG